MALNREAILKADDLPTREVDVPEWQGSVLVRGLTAGERDDFETTMLAAREQGAAASSNIRAQLVVRAIVDEDRNRVFSDGDTDELSGKSAAVLDRLFGEVLELSGMKPDAVAEAEGNSGAAASGGSPSS